MAEVEASEPPQVRYRNPVSRMRHLSGSSVPLIPTAAISVVLFILPFYWLGPNATVGGDDTRLYYLYPTNWILNFALSTFGGLSGFGTYSTPQHFIPFDLALTLFHFLIPQANLEALAFGILMVSGFLGTFALVMLLIPRPHHSRIAAATLAGLMYITAPIIATMFWAHSLAWVIGIDGAPVVIVIAAVYLKSGEGKWLFLFALVSAFFAAGLEAIPVSVPFLFCAAAVFSTSFLFATEKRRLLVRVIVVTLVATCANAFWLIPFLAEFTMSSSFIEGAMATSQTAETTIRAVIQGSSIFYTLLLLPSKDWLQNYGNPTYRVWNWSTWRIAMDALFLLVLVIGMMMAVARRTVRDALFVSLFAATLVLAYLQTVNLTFVGVELFVQLVKSVPGFGMFRNFFSKFAAAYGLCYSVSFGIALSMLLSRVRGVYRLLTACVFMTVVILEGVPMLTGSIIYSPSNSPGPGAVAYRDVGEIPPSYLAAMRYLSAHSDGGRVLELPLSANYWSILPLSQANSFYVGNSPVSILSGVNPFNSVDSFFVPGFPQLRDRLQSAIASRDFTTVGSVLRLSGVHYILYTEGIAVDAGKRWLQLPVFPASLRDMDILARAIGAVNVAHYSTGGSASWDVYAINADETLPRVFITNQVRLVASNDILVDAASTGSVRRSDVASPSGVGQIAVSRLAALLPTNDVIWAGSPDVGDVKYFDHPHSWNYSLGVNVRQPSLIVLAERYDSNWVARVSVKESASGIVVVRRIRVNGYATAWLLPASGDYLVELRYERQRYSWIGDVVSMAAMIAIIVGTLVQRCVVCGVEQRNVRK